MSELSEIFVGKWFKYISLVLVVVYGFFGCWSFSAVAGSAWATNIPYNFGAMEICDSDAFQHRTLPSDGCLYSYYFGLFLFGLIVITLSIMDLKEQVVVHVFFGVLRYLTIIIIIVYCIIKLAIGGNACAEEYPELPPNTTIGPGITYGEIVLHFDPKAWMISIPVFVYAFMIHSGVSSLTHPIKQKKYLHWMMITNFAIAEICLLSLGVIAPLWFKESVQETITLNWVSLKILIFLAIIGRRHFVLERQGCLLVGYCVKHALLLLEYVLHYINFLLVILIVGRGWWLRIKRIEVWSI